MPRRRVMPKPFAQETAAMHYKTIVLELIQQQYPALYEQLRQSRTLLQAVNDTATALKRYHEDWTDRLSQAKPDSDPSQIAIAALELALEDLQESLRSESPPDETEAPVFLDGAMNYLRRHTPPA
jgi:septal ring factor EnvC (AmiA/AmiB activator)